MPESEKLCRQMLDRLHFLHDSVAPLDAFDPLKKSYMDVVVRFLKLMRRKPLLLRLASSQRLIFVIRELQLKLTDVARRLDLAYKPEMMQWEYQWDDDCAEQFDKLNKLVTRASERLLMSEFRGDKKAQEALMTLNSGMKWKGQSPEMLALKQATFSRMSSYVSNTGLRVFDWFIPIDDVEVEDEAIGNRVTFGDVCKGSWIHDGERTEVAIKQILNENASDDAFLRLLDVWTCLPDNDHILKLYGGSRLSEPQFYICEFARFGSFIKLFAYDTNNGLFWQLFKQASEGLEFLHSHNVVHGALKCSDILVGRDSVKLADFGINNLGEDMSAMAVVTAEIDQQRMLSMQWKPKEVLVDSDGSGPRYESDIYSLGMCMIEAKANGPPFGVDHDEAVLDKVIRGQMPERPEGLSDAEWEFISRLCHPELSQRPTLKEVLDEIEKFAATEEAEMRLADFFVSGPKIVSHSSNDPPKATEPTQQSSVCSSCTESSDDSQQSCRCCGFPLKMSDGNITRHSFATYVKSHTKDEVLQRLYDVALTLQDLREQGIVHANVVPGNIRTGRDGCAQLVGFEFSKTLDELASGAVPKREDGLRYLAPECLSGKNPSFESDVYSLAMCAVYALSREPPWGLLTTDEELKLQILSLHAIPDKPAVVSDAEWKLVKQMCTYDPADRMIIADVVCCLAKLVSNAFPEAPGWRLEPDLVKYPEADGALMSRTPFVSRHLGQWKDAVVAVVKLEEGFFAMGRSFHSVADLWYSLKHPAIQQLYGAYGDKGMVFVCENAERGELSSHLGSNLKDIDVWKVLLDAALALHYMHCRGIVHGDIGLHNILVTADGRGKLSGFSLSSQQNGAHPRQCSPEDEPTTEEEWRPLACSQGHHADYSSDVYWLGRCIIDAIGDELMRSMEIPSTSKCAKCSMGKLPPQPKSFSVEEWRLVSDMCHGDIEMCEVVDRLAQIAAVNAVVGSRLKNISTPLPSNARQKVQGMMLAKLRQYEEEDMKRKQGDDYDDYSDCDEDDESSAQTLMSSIELQLTYAASEVFGSNFETALVEYDSKNWNISAIPPTHLKTPSVAWRKCLYEWALNHESIVEANADEINHGGYASVWLGKWFGSPVALKRLSRRDQGQSLREEANLWFRVRHPHIVGLFGACCTGSHMFVCDLVEGWRLDHFCRGEPKPAPVVIWGLLHEAAVGLQGLHSFGIVHADLKCDNILVTSDKRAKLIDFGLSCLSTCDGGKPQGAPRWKAPECLEGGGPTFTSDVFSFAMCIIQAISGAYPWGNLIDAGVMYQVKEGKLPKQPTAFSIVQWELIKRMCRFKPEERLELDFVIKVLGYFAKRAPYVNDQLVQETLASWESGSSP
ncbi:hypothetical protein PF008_g22482 [Phytophthora fragariae]|uniref:Protein kinase domain-containing protein n=1 Tax=Phytophthora fragariae TaxID=53985 RepID=A0A6G0QUN3_9STRA|nr:hypothetical protein PF008_g22482 [Phytophthora fragariae]